MLLFIPLVLSAKISREPISGRYLSQIRDENSTSYSDQAILWAMAELGAMLDKTVTMDEVERELSRRIYDILERVDVSHEMMKEALDVMSKDIKNTKEIVSAAIQTAGEHLSDAQEEMRIETLKEIEKLLDMVDNVPSELSAGSLKSVRRVVKGSLKEIAPGLHHILFFGFQILFLVAILYYQKLMRALRMY